MKHGKNYRKSKENLDRTKEYALADALELVDGFAKAKFDETVDVAFRLNVNPRHADQNVGARNRGSARGHRP